MKCDYCSKEWIDTMESLALKTYHTIIFHGVEVNE